MCSFFEFLLPPDSDLVLELYETDRRTIATFPREQIQNFHYSVEVWRNFIQELLSLWLLPLRYPMHCLMISVCDPCQLHSEHGAGESYQCVHEGFRLNSIAMSKRYNCKICNPQKHNSSLLIGSLTVDSLCRSFYPLDFDVDCFARVDSSKTN